MKIPSLFQASSGFLTLEFEAYDSPEWLSAVNMLENDLGFVRKGETLTNMDEGILPSFIKESLIISAGWDNWSGCYLLLESKESDVTLRVIYEKFIVK